ncbi:unnamed protein product, partial [marine sediment metagenome]
WQTDKILGKYINQGAAFCKHAARRGFAREQ